MKESSRVRSIMKQKLPVVIVSERVQVRVNS